MSLSKKSLEFWKKYCLDAKLSLEGVNITEGPAGNYETTDELLDLYISGKKTASSSLLSDYKSSGDELPVVGKQFWIVLDSSKDPKIILKTLKVEYNLFKSVPERIAVAEGEGDLSLSFWREVHIEFFTPFFKAWGVHELEEETVVTEHFELVYKDFS